MTDLKRRSVRMLFDLQICQTPGYAQRGVGHYSRSLFSAVGSVCRPRELFALVSDDLPYTVCTEPVNESRVLRMPRLPAWNTGHDYEGGDRDSLNSRAYLAMAQNANPDIVHVAHVFPDSNDAVALPSATLAAPGQVVSATLYDLIRSLFPEHYLKDARVRKRYLAQVAQLSQFDLLLAISESTRRDAIDLLGIEPWRIAVIHGGISAAFNALSDNAVARLDLEQRYPLRKNVVLCVGGDDYRKNLDGMVRAFAGLPGELRLQASLVVVCEMSQTSTQSLMNCARKLGLASDDVLFTGFVSTADLIAFYRSCSVFVYPSLYEGLGLPVLEAMACGAPVLGANNSSIREIIEREDALFDGTDPDSIAAAIHRVLTDDDFAADLRDYGVTRSGDFSWRRSAALALDAFDDALARKRAQGVASVVGGWLPRKRLAVVSPLPPCRSGIADYNAEFAPFLARHFMIDFYVDGYRVTDERLTTAFRIYDISDLAPVASSYDAILYEFGNSGFHAHMLPLLETHPGVVDLHDAYYGSLFGYLDHELGESGRCVSEMLTAHGPRARRYLVADQRLPEALGSAIIDLPCSKRILDHAVGVISHSPFNLQVARENYAQGWPGPYRIIPQMVRALPPVSAAAWSALREQLDFANDAFIVATFGHVAWTKCGDRLFDAFLQSALVDDPKVSLIFVGALATDDFGNRLQKAIKRSKLGKRVRITGFVAAQDYSKYLQISDLAVQLRTASRGGTPRAVLDCLANGVPVAVNNDASYTDYPDDVVVKWAPDPSPADIADELCKLYRTPAKLRDFAEAGRRYIKEHHDPARCAAEYATAINEFVARYEATRSAGWVAHFAAHLAGCGDTPAATELAANWLESRAKPGFDRRRLYIDVSHIASEDNGTGIQRVVKEIVGALYRTSRSDVEAVAVELVDSKLRVATTWLHAQGLLMLQELTATTADVVTFHGGDILLMLDSSWARYSEFYPVFEDARRRRVPVVTAVYDLLPLMLDNRYFVDGGREWFEGWLRDAIRCSDSLLCISQSVAEEVVGYIAKCDRGKGSSETPSRVGYWHLGSDFHRGTNPPSAGGRVQTLKSIDYLLMVGTIEPRKLHALAVAALEKLWQDGHRLALCIAGKEGWMTGDFMDHLRAHPRLGETLFFIETPTDEELEQLYDRAAGILYLSVGEGFGLPIIEAADHGVPVICSDIPVFREIAGDHATYVNSGDAESLARQLDEWWLRRQQNELPDVTGMPRRTWQESADSLLQVVIDDSWFWSNENGIQPN